MRRSSSTSRASRSRRLRASISSSSSGRPSAGGASRSAVPPPSRRARRERKITCPASLFPRRPTLARRPRSKQPPPARRDRLDDHVDPLVLEAAVLVEPALEIGILVGDAVVRTPALGQVHLLPCPDSPLAVPGQAEVVVDPVEVDEPQVGIPVEALVLALVEARLPLHRDARQRRLVVGVVRVPVPALVEDRTAWVERPLPVAEVVDLVAVLGGEEPRVIAEPERKQDRLVVDDRHHGAALSRPQLPHPATVAPVLPHRLPELP